MRTQKIISGNPEGIYTVIATMRSFDSLEEADEWNKKIEEDEEEGAAA